MYKNDGETPGRFAEKSLSQKVKRAAAMAGFLVGGGLGMVSDNRLPDEVAFMHADAQTDIAGTMTIMTANVHQWEGQEGNNLDSFLAVLEQEKPDVVCMQEVLADGSELTDLYQAGYNVYFNTAGRSFSEGREGNAVISRAPLTIVDTIPLPNSQTTTPRNAILFEAETAAGKISFANTHLSINAVESAYQSSYLYGRLNGTVEVMCGDFNQRPETVRVGAFGAMGSSALFAAGVSTFPARDPKWEIDYVLAGCGEQTAGQGRVIAIDSDHLARIEEVNLSGCE